jgi:hypothetical protein
MVDLDYVLDEIQNLVNSHCLDEDNKITLMYFLIYLSCRY